MKFVLYESMEQWCDHEIVFEDYLPKEVISVWCEDCLFQHYFFYVESFEKFEEIWEYMEEE